MVAGDMFPTHVGMNRDGCGTATANADVPHTRGDEPRAYNPYPPLHECSPHTWG